MARSTVFNFRRPPTVYTPQPVSRGPPLSALRPPAASSLALTYWKWGQKSLLAAAAIAAGLLTTGVLFWLAWLAPETVPATAFLVLQILDSGGKTASNWIGAGIGLAVFTSLIGALCCLCPHQRSQSERICRYAVLRRHGPRPTRLLFPRRHAGSSCAHAIRA
jgi:hypothetical protein